MLCNLYSRISGGLWHFVILEHCFQALFDSLLSYLDTALLEWESIEIPISYKGIESLLLSS